MRAMNQPPQGPPQGWDPNQPAWGPPPQPTWNGQPLQVEAPRPRRGSHPLSIILLVALLVVGAWWYLHETGTVIIINP